MRARGGGASLEEYKKCIGDLKAVMEPAFTRAYEAEVRPKVLEGALKEVNTWTELVGRWNVTHPQVSFVCVCVCVCVLVCVLFFVWQQRRDSTPGRLAHYCTVVRGGFVLHHTGFMSPTLG